MPRGRLVIAEVIDAGEDFIKEIVVGIEPDEDPPSCWDCGSYNVVVLKIDGDEEMAEYRCNDCGEYFVGEWHDRYK